MKDSFVGCVIVAVVVVEMGCYDPAAAEPLFDDSASAIVSSPPFYGDPANSAVFAVDVSHWEGPLSQREMDCFWDSGVRHVIAGTQVQEVTRQQLAIAVARGMTIDAYVYLYWDDVTAQVDRAFDIARDMPIGRMWIDVEQDPGSRGAATLIARVEEAMSACRAHGSATCGIYTGMGFWREHMNDTNAFADVPLWFAHYDGERSLARWSDERFGGWERPVAKQWAEEALCSVGVDKDTMQVTLAPTVTVDRTEPPRETLPPAAPTDLYPAHGSIVSIDVVKLMTGTVPHATRYQLALEWWRSGAFVTYATWTTADPFKRTFPVRGMIYRFRARAMNAYGWGGWSAWSMFDYGVYRGTRPGTVGTHTTDVDGGAATPAPAPSASGMSPDGATITTPSVTLSCPAVAGAARYDVATELDQHGVWVPYVTYQSSTCAKTFYPIVHGAGYRWRVRAESSAVWSEWSAWATFYFE